ncbi:MAG: hypothetical protein QM655_12620 [Nocardioidaceae bacterium]
MTPVAPPLSQVMEYLGEAGASWPSDQVAAAIAAEVEDQVARLRFPGGAVPFYNAALTEALCRRVAHNLAVRSLPLGFQPTVSEAAAVATQVGGTDAEVRRLEAPYKRLVFG